MDIYAFHLLNDYSGSPKVLMQLVKGWSRHGHTVHVVTCSNRRGFLSDVPGVTHHTYWYRWAAHPGLRLVNFTLSQLILFFKFFSRIKKTDIVYVNTVFPFGAAVLGRVKGCRVIYHVHETTVKPNLLKQFLFGMLRITASDVVYVSRYVAEQVVVRRAAKHTLYNAIEDDFLCKAQNYRKPAGMPRHVLMVCSLKAYKGVREFVQLAAMMPDLDFRLVVNASQDDIDSFFAGSALSTNLRLFAVQTDLHPFYQWADVVVNLSRPDGWVETFGLTILEGMAYGLPAIVPPVGGITELVADGVNGYHADARDVETLSARLRALCTPSIHTAMRRQAQQAVHAFSEDRFLDISLRILHGTPDGKSFHDVEHPALQVLKNA